MSKIKIIKNFFLLSVIVLFSFYSQQNSKELIDISTASIPNYNSNLYTLTNAYIHYYENTFIVNSSNIEGKIVGSPSGHIGMSLRVFIEILPQSNSSVEFLCYHLGIWDPLPNNFTLAPGESFGPTNFALVEGQNLDDTGRFIYLAFTIPPGTNATLHFWIGLYSWGTHRISTLNTLTAFSIFLLLTIGIKLLTKKRDHS